MVNEVFKWILAQLSVVLEEPRNSHFSTLHMKEINNQVKPIFRSIHQVSDRDEQRTEAWTSFRVSNKCSGNICTTARILHKVIES